MAREGDFATRMLADATLMAILLGGVFQSGGVGLEGITRDAAPTAFGTDGFLKPVALVRQRGNVPDNQVRDGLAQATSAVQVVEIWLYQDSGYTAIDAALARLYVLFEGYAFTGDNGSFPVAMVNVIDRQRDQGSLMGASMARQDWAVYSVMGA